MAIENLLERIADTLETLVQTQTENMQINAWYKSRLLGRPVRSVVDEIFGEAEVETKSKAAVEAVAPLDSAELPQGLAWNGPAPSEQPQPEMTFEELKAALHVRGYDFPKGTKRTTLAKAWEAHKDEPVKPHEPSPVEPPPLDVNPAGYAPSLTEAPAPAPAEAPVPAPESAKPLSRDEAAARIRAHYTASPEDREIFKKALVAAGVQKNGSFRDVADGKFDILVETYERLKGTANA